MKKMLIAITLLMLPSLTSAMEPSRDREGAVPLTLRIVTPNPVDRTMSPLTLTEDELVKRLAEIDGGTHKVANIHRIPLNFYDLILDLAAKQLSEKAFTSDFTKLLISLWGIGDITYITEKEKNIPIIINAICENLKEAKEKILNPKRAEGE